MINWGGPHGTRSSGRLGAATTAQIPPAISTGPDEARPSRANAATSCQKDIQSAKQFWGGRQELGSRRPS